MGRSCDYARRLCLLWNHRWDSNTAEKREVGDSAVDKEFDSHATNERRQTGLDGPYHNQEKPDWRIRRGLPREAVAEPLLN